MQNSPPFQGKMVAQHPWALLENRAWLPRKVSQLEKLRWRGAQEPTCSALPGSMLCTCVHSSHWAELWFPLQELTSATSPLGFSGNFIPSALTSSPRVCALGYHMAQAHAGSHHAALLHSSKLPPAPAWCPRVPAGLLPSCKEDKLCILKGMRRLSHSTVFSCGPILMLGSHTSHKLWLESLRQELWGGGKEPLDLAQKENNLFSSRLSQKWVSRPDDQKTQVAIETRMPSTRRRNKCRPIFLLSWLLLRLLLPAAAQGSISSLQLFCPQLHQSLSPAPRECTRGHVGTHRDRDTTAAEPAPRCAWGTPNKESTDHSSNGKSPRTAAQAHPKQHLPGLLLWAWQGGLQEEWLWNWMFVLDYSSHLWFK